MADTPRIYVASLSDYNAGRLHGCWIDADQDADDIREEIQKMLARSKIRGAEEWAIHDYENFGSLSLHEHEDLERIAEAAELIEEHGEMATGVMSYYGGLDYLDDAREALEERYAGSGTDLADWAWGFAEETEMLKSVPENLRGYFDFDKYARDLEYGGEVFTVEADGEVHVFWTR